jgi:hypothetical protein
LEREAFRGRLGGLGRYGGPLGAALARQRVDQMRRDIAENQAIGPDAARLLGIQTENDRLNQTLGAIKSLQQSREQEARLAKENAALRKEIAKLSKTVQGAAALVDKIQKGGVGSSWNAVSGYAGKCRGIIPHHAVVTKTADLLCDVDAQVQLALRLAAKPRPD